jgi:protein-S-isoprenylcysteine O-methyltransferase Ste14
MRASEFEFRYRFWIFGAIFWLAFLCYTVDRTNAGEAIVRWLAPGLGDVRERAAMHLVFGIGAAIAALGVALRSWATAYLRADVVHDSVVHSEGLVADGPYRHVRNPLYLGTQVLMLGVALVTSRLGAAVLVVAGLLYHLRLIGREEAALEAAQGDAFRSYRARVPKFVFSPAARVPHGGRRPAWAQGFVGEGFMWAFVIALVVFAVTFDVRALLAVGFGGAALYWGLVALFKRRAARA